jgi:hypothetical protein
LEKQWQGAGLWLGWILLQGVVVVVANQIYRGQPRLWCGPIGCSQGSGVFSAGLPDFFLVQCHGGDLSSVSQIFLDTQRLQKLENPLAQLTDRVASIKKITHSPANKEYQPITKT